MSIDHLIGQFGLLAIFLGAGVEGEAAAVAGGLLAHRGLIPLWQVALANFAGSLATGQVLFLVAHASRNAAWVRRLSARPAYQTVTRTLGRWPVRAILTYRLVPGARVLTPLILGGSQLGAVRFAGLNALGAALWASVFTGLGYAFGQGVERVFGRLPSAPHLMLIGLAVVAVLITAFLARRWRMRARAAFPSG